MTAPGAGRVSTLELFFDLVFVFTITQLTSSLVHELSWRGVVQVCLLLGITWWMYSGYAWLTNSVRLNNSSRRLLYMVGMAGFLVMALAVPSAYAGSGFLFGLGYVLVTVVHAGMFLSAGGPGVVRAMAWLAPLNLISASLVLIGGLVPGGWRYALWALALAVQIASPYLHPIGGFDVRAGHFVERHGLVMIIALGESVVAIGVGAAGLPITVPLITAAVLGLALAYQLWWCYFGGDDTFAEHALAEIADPAKRSRAALVAFGYAHYPMLLGIIALSAGVKKAMGHATEHSSAAGALALAGGVALFVLGEVWFRRSLRLGRLRWRSVAVAATLATLPIGVYVSAAAQLAALAVVLTATYITEWKVPDPAGAANPWSF